MADPHYMIPLTLALGDAWPSDLVQLVADSPVGDVLGKIGLVQLELSAPASVSASLMFRGELRLELPGLSGVMLVFGSDYEGHTSLDLQLQLADPFYVGINPFPIQLRFPREVLKPVIPDTEHPDGQFKDDTDPTHFVEIGISPSIGFSGDGTCALSGLEDVVISTRFMIADSGIVLDIPHIELYLSEGDPPPDNLPDGWRGVFIPRAVVHLPRAITIEGLPSALEFTNCGIGSGGFTGVLSGDWADPPLGARLLGFIARLKRIDLALQQNAFLRAAVEGEIDLSFFKATVGVALSLEVDGEFSATLSAVPRPEGEGGSSETPDGLITFTQSKLLTAIVETMRFGNVNDVFRFTMSGRLKPLLADLDWPVLDIKALSIDEHGNADLDGGWIDVPESATLDFHGFKIDTSEFGMGTEGEGEDRRQWLGVSGGISLVEGIPITGSVDGLKFSWDPDDPSDLDVSLRGIGVRLEIPKTLLLEGAVSYKKLSEHDGGPTGLTGHLFTGHARLDLYALRTEISAELIVGRINDTNTGQSFSVFFIVLDAELPTALPLGATGTAIYALKGLFGLNAAPNRQLLDGEMEPWYRWYKENRCRDGRECPYTVTPVDKWQPQFDHYAFGAGLTLGTQFDDGFSLNAGAVVAILIPGPVIMIDGKANLLKNRGKKSGKDAEGAFHALAVFDGLASTFQLNVDVQYNLADVIEVGGGLEAFFNFNNSRNWYIHIGEKEPEDKRIRATVLSIITANSYLMIEPTGIQIGAWTGVNFDESYGPVRLVLKAFIAFDADIWWKEPHFEGRIQLYAEVAVKIFGIGLALILETLLAGRAPQPYWIYGKARVAFTLPWPLPDFDLTVELEWGQEGQPHFIEYLKRADLIHHKLIGKSWQMGDSEENAPVVPLDATPALSFAKPLYGLSMRKAGDGSDEWDFKEQVDEWEFTYSRPSIELHVKEEDETWTLLKQSPLTTVGDGTTVTPFDVRSENLLPDVYAQEPQLLLWRYGPLHTANRPAREDYEPHCPTQQPAPLICFNWREVPSGTVYPLEFRHAGVVFALPVAAQHAPAQVRDGRLNTPKFSMLLPEPVHYLEIRYRIEVHPDPGRQIYVRGQVFAQGKHIRDLAPEPIGSGEARLLLPDSFNWNVDTVRVEIWSGSGSGGLVVVPGDTRDARIDLIQVCYRTAASLERQYLTDPSRVDESGEFLSRGLQLEPNRTYRLTVGTTRTEKQQASAVDVSTITLPPQIYYFRTADVPGMAYRPEEKPDFAGTPLNDLATYIDQTIPSHGAKTHYYQYDVALTFNEAYARGFYQDVHLGLRDRNGKPLGEPLSGEFTSWLPLLTDGLLTYAFGQGAHPCEVAPRPPVQQRQYVYRPTNDLLAPQRMYYVEVMAPAETRDTVLHAFQFTTSRFATIEAHLSSGLREDGQTVHTLPAGPPPAMTRRTERTDRERVMFAALDELREIVTRSGELAVLEIASVLDRLETATTELELLNKEIFEQIDAGVQPLFEALNMGQRDLPSVLEFIRIPIAETGRSFLLLESPEPLDWRRLTIKCFLSADERDVHVIWNCDQTRAYICLQSGEGFDRGTYRLQFLYVGGGPERPDLAPITHNGEIVSADDISFMIEL